MLLIRRKDFYRPASTEPTATGTAAEHGATQPAG
jgi:hypothetical protein